MAKRTAKTATPETGAAPEKAVAKKVPAKKAAAKKVAAKKVVAKKAPAKKVVAKKLVAKKTADTAAAKPPKVAAAKKAPAARKKATSRAKPGQTKGFLFIPKDQYKELIDGLRAQGLDHDDAVLTLKVGIRQANGRPVPADLLQQCANDPYAAPTEELIVEQEQQLAA